MTTSTSCQSGDERWYDILQDLDVAPPLPSKMAAAHARSNNNNTYPSTPKRGNLHQISAVQVSQTTQHNHYPAQNIQHSKIQVRGSQVLEKKNEKNTIYQKMFFLQNISFLIFFFSAQKLLVTINLCCATAIQK